MSERADCDLAILGAGAAGLIAADFALQLRARVILVEADRIGGDCTWTGCVPSKSLLHAAGVAAAVRSAARYGVHTAEPRVDMRAVRAYLRSTIEHVYAPTAPEALRARGLQVLHGPARFLDARSVQVQGRSLRARRFLICTGAEPRRPAWPALAGVPHQTYQEIFDNERLPHHLLVVGGGPLGCELAQAYRRLGSQVTLIATRLLPRAEPQAAALLERAFAAEGIERVMARAEAAERIAEGVRVQAGARRCEGDLLLLAVGREPRVQGLELAAAGVRYGARGIEVDEHLRTSVPHIYAAGDVTGAPQYSHLAGWQAFHAVRNALLPGASSATAAALPQVTFTQPEVAQVGLLEQQARERFGERVRSAALELGAVDRAVSEDDRHGLVKLVAHADGRLLGATVMAARAGEAISELSLALSQRRGVRELAAAVHPYPTYNSAIQLLATRLATERFVASRLGRAARWMVRSRGR